MDIDIFGALYWYDTQAQYKEGAIYFNLHLFSIEPFTYELSKQTFLVRHNHIDHIWILSQADAYLSDV